MRRIGSRWVAGLGAGNVERLAIPSDPRAGQLENVIDHRGNLLRRITRFASHFHL
jgi:hypothetical protein